MSTAVFTQLWDDLYTVPGQLFLSVYLPHCLSLSLFPSLPCRWMYGQQVSPALNQVCVNIAIIYIKYSAPKATCTCCAYGFSHINFRMFNMKIHKGLCVGLASHLRAWLIYMYMYASHHQFIIFVSQCKFSQIITIVNAWSMYMYNVHVPLMAHKTSLSVIHVQLQHQYMQ